MKNIFYQLCLAGLFSVTMAACGGNTAKNTAETTPTNYASLKTRTGELAKAEEWPVVQTKAQELLVHIKEDPADTKSKLLLVQLYMQEARITGEHPYYYPAILVILEDILKQEPNSFEALAFKSSVQLSLHHFAEALETGKKAQAINADNGFIYGVLCDANVELGNYEEAVKMSDKMQQVRPGLESYSRASYLREIYGQNTPAIEAMKLAWKAGLPGSEQAAWAGNVLGHLYENTGDLEKAGATYRMVLQQRPTYAFAMAGLARVESHKGNYTKSLELLNSAVELMPEVSFYEDMAEVYLAEGKPEKARETYKTVISMLQEDAKSGHYVDMEMAGIYLKLDDVPHAWEHAKKEYDRRPENIDANNMLAWVYYSKGDMKQAQQHMEKAMRMNTQNAELLCRAGVITAAAGNKKEGTQLIKKALRLNPYLPSDLLAKAAKA